MWSKEMTAWIATILFYLFAGQVGASSLSLEVDARTCADRLTGMKPFLLVYDWPGPDNIRPLITGILGRMASLVGENLLPEKLLIFVNEERASSGFNPFQNALIVGILRPDDLPPTDLTGILPHEFAHVILSHFARYHIRGQYLSFREARQLPQLSNEESINLISVQQNIFAPYEELLGDLLQNHFSHDAAIVADTIGLPFTPPFQISLAGQLLSYRLRNDTAVRPRDASQPISFKNWAAEPDTGFGNYTLFDPNRFVLWHQYLEHLADRQVPAFALSFAQAMQEHADLRLSKSLSAKNQTAEQLNKEFLLIFSRRAKSNGLGISRGRLQDP